MNKVIIEGHLGRDAKVKENQNGTKFITFPMAVNWSKKKNEEVTTWYDIISSKPEHTGTLAQYLTSGKGVIVVGDLEPALNQGVDGKYYMNLIVKPDSITFSNNTKRSESTANVAGGSTTTYSQSKPSNEPENEPVRVSNNIPNDDEVDMGNIPTLETPVANDGNVEDDDLPF